MDIPSNDSIQIVNGAVLVDSSESFMIITYFVNVLLVRTGIEWFSHFNELVLYSVSTVKERTCLSSHCTCKNAYIGAGLMERYYLCDTLLC